MTDQEKVTLIEVEQRSKSNSYRIDSLEQDIKDIREEQSEIHRLATSVEVIAQKMNYIEEKVSDTNQKVDAQSKAWVETERKLEEKIVAAENRPYRETAGNVNTVKVAIVTAVCTAIISGLVATIISMIH